MDPNPLADALLARALGRNVHVLVENEQGARSKRLTLTLRSRSAVNGGGERAVVHVVATGELGMIDFDNVYNFVRPIDSEDEDDISETADDFINLAVAYLRGEGQIVRVGDWLCGTHNAFVVNVNSMQYEIGEGNHVSRFRPV